MRFILIKLLRLLQSPFFRFLPEALQEIPPAQNITQGRTGHIQGRQGRVEFLQVYISDSGFNFIQVAIKLPHLLRLCLCIPIQSITIPIKSITYSIFRWVAGWLADLILASGGRNSITLAGGRQQFGRKFHTEFASLFYRQVTFRQWILIPFPEHLNASFFDDTNKCQLSLFRAPGVERKLADQLITQSIFYGSVDLWIITLKAPKPWDPLQQFPSTIIVF